MSFIQDAKCAKDRILEYWEESDKRKTRREKKNYNKNEKKDKTKYALDAIIQSLFQLDIVLHALRENKTLNKLELPCILMPSRLPLDPVSIITNQINWDDARNACWPYMIRTRNRNTAPNVAQNAECARSNMSVIQCKSVINVAKQQ